MLDLSKNHFELFGMPVGFMVDGEELAARYRALQRVVHPDRYARATDHERRLSLQGASKINEAYLILKDPVARARYLLSLYGIDMDASKETTTDSEFLMEQLAMREELAAARQTSDPYAVVADLMSRINQSIKRLTGQMAVQFETGTPDQLEQAREIVRKMQFLQKLRADAEVVEAEMDDAV